MIRPRWKLAGGWLAWAWMLFLVVAGPASAYTEPTEAQKQEIQAKLDEVNKLYKEYLKYEFSDAPWAERYEKKQAIAEKMTRPAQIAIYLVDLYYSLEAEGKNAPGEPIFDPKLSTYGSTDGQGYIRIGPMAYETLPLLLHTKLHEFVHADQAAQKRFPANEKQRLMAELEAYYMELKIAKKSGMDAAGVAAIESAIYRHEKGLGEENLEKVHRGDFVAEAVPLKDALESGQVSMKLEGKGVAAGAVFVAHLERLSPEPFLLEIASGTPLCPDSPGVQTMMVARDVFVPLTQNRTSLEIPGYCLDPHLPPPPPSQPGVTPVGWSVANPCEQPERFEAPREVVRAGRRLSGAGKFHTDMPPAKYCETVVQRALWHLADPQGFGKQRLSADLEAQVKSSGGRQSPEQIQQLTDHLWDDVDLTLKESRTKVGR